METKIKLNIKDWAEDDRPREKMLNLGVDSLSNAELLAILIGSGNRDETAVELTKRILASCDNNLNILGQKKAKELCHFKGIGSAKAVTIEAAMELGKRRKRADIEDTTYIKNSIDIYHIFHPLLCELATEEFWIILLNQSNKIIDKQRMSTGGLSGTVADPRSILREALIQRATSIALCHNHPSGQITPSHADNVITSKINQSGKLMDITLIDHIIIGSDKYYSYADEGKL